MICSVSLCFNITYWRCQNLQWVQVRVSSINVHHKRMGKYLFLGTQNNFTPLTYSHIVWSPEDLHPVVRLKQLSVHISGSASVQLIGLTEQKLLLGTLQRIISHPGDMGVRCTSVHTIWIKYGSVQISVMVAFFLHFFSQRS